MLKEEQTTEQKILSTLKEVLYRLDKIDKKLEVKDSYNLSDYFNKCQIPEGYELSDESSTEYIKYKLMNKLG